MKRNLNSFTRKKNCLSFKKKTRPAQEERRETQLSLSPKTSDEKIKVNTLKRRSIQFSEEELRTRPSHKKKHITLSKEKLNSLSSEKLNPARAKKNVNRTPTHTACTDAHSVSAHTLHSMIFHHANTRGSRAHSSGLHAVVSQKQFVILASCLVPCHT